MEINHRNHYIILYRKSNAEEHPYFGRTGVAFYHRNSLLMLNYNDVIVVIE